MSPSIAAQSAEADKVSVGAPPVIVELSQSLKKVVFVPAFQFLWRDLVGSELKRSYILNFSAIPHPLACTHDRQFNPSH